MSESQVSLVPSRFLASRGSNRAFKIPGVEDVAIGRTNANSIPDAIPDGHVLVLVGAFSCNYRDRAVAESLSAELNSSSRNVFVGFGSEFVGTVVRLGSEVKTLAEGDVVIPDCSYGEPVAGVVRGIPTNFASSRYLCVPAAKLRRSNLLLSRSELACFSLGAQTALSMCRRSGFEAGEEVGITAGRSSTSMYLIQAVLAMGGRPVVFSSNVLPDYLSGLSPRIEWIQYSGQGRNMELRSVLGDRRFGVMLDPFFDVYAPQLLPQMAFGGSYVTCGVAAQGSAGRAAPRPELASVVFEAMLANVSVITNCLGLEEDLSRAIEFAEEGTMRPLGLATFHASAVDRFASSVFGSSVGPKSVCEY